MSPTAPPQIPILTAGSVIPDAGTLVGVPVAPARGEPGAPVVAVTVKPWWQSASIWLSGSGAVYFILDALAPIVKDILAEKSPPTDWWPIVQRMGLALIFGYIAWRRHTDNHVIGSGSPPGEAG